MESGINDNISYRNILERTSVRRFSDRKITESETEAILRAAMSAPSGVNRQPWEFVVVEDKTLLSALADALPYAKMAASAPLVIIVCGNRERFLDGDDSTLWVQDLSAATENLLLAAHALGLGGVWTCLYPHNDRMEAVSEILNLPSEWVPFNLVPVGQPLTNHPPMDKWHPERIHRVSPIERQAPDLNP